jgi:hypothetical protein
MEQIGIFDLLDQDLCKYLGLTHRTWVELTEKLSDEKLSELADLCLLWLDGESVKSEILEVLGINENNE